jgi:hypothetical protein
MTVPEWPPMIPPTIRPEAPTIISALFSGVDPDSMRTAVRCGSLTAAIDVAFVHDDVGAVDGARSMMGVDGTIEDGATGAPRTVVSESGELFCATSGVATSNTAIAVATLRRWVM